MEDIQRYREDGTRIVPYRDRSHSVAMERHAVAFLCAVGIWASLSRYNLWIWILGPEIAR